MTGFPWMALGYGQVDNGFAGWAPVLGVYGVSFMLALVASAIVATVMAQTMTARTVGLAIIITPWLIGTTLR